MSKINKINVSGIDYEIEDTSKQPLEEGKGLSTNDYTNEEKEKLASLSNYDDTEVKKELESKANSSDIPTKTSELTNDSGFLSSIPSEYITETELNAKGYLTEQQDISGKANISDLNEHVNNSDIHITSSERTTWNNKSNFSGSYDDLTNKPSIPTKTSELTNDSGFLATSNIVTLFKNSSGSDGTITLSESVANFSYIEIFYMSYSLVVGTYLYNSLKIENANNKAICLSSYSVDSSEPRCYLSTASYKVSGTSLTLVNNSYCQYQFNIAKPEEVGTIGNNPINITKVIGYR